MEISGQDSFLGQHGMIHKYLKNLARELVKPENLKEKMLPEMDKVARIHMRSWASQGTVDVKEVASNVKYFLTWLFQYNLRFYLYVFCV